jgi:hypothetical protein
MTIIDEIKLYVKHGKLPIVDVLAGLSDEDKEIIKERLK